MKVLVATVSALLLVDLKTAAVKVVENHRSEYYGISWWPNSDSIVLSHTDFDNTRLDSLQNYVNSEKGLLSFGQHPSSTFLSDPHQILCAPDQQVITTNTGKNCITIYDKNTDFRRDIRINDVPWDRFVTDNPYGEHFNSVFLKNNFLYVLAHGWKKGSYILQYTYPQCELIKKYPIKHKTGLHNIWIDEAENIFACHSEAGGLVEVHSNELLWSSSHASFTRGMAVANDIIIIGDSGLISRNNRKSSCGDLWILDRKTFQTLDFIPLGNYGVVREVRILDTLDEAHPNGVFKNIAALENNESNASLNDEQQNRRQKKLITNQVFLENKNTWEKFDFITGAFAIENSAWLCSQKDISSLLLLKKNPSSHFELSVEYAFDCPKSGYLGFVFGYKGNQQANMLMFVLNYFLWKNLHEKWGKFKKLFWQCLVLKNKISPIAKTGCLTIQRRGEKITIICNNKRPVTYTFSPDELEGEVGIRCLNARFKNFRIKNL